MSPVILPYHDQTGLAHSLVSRLGGTLGETETRRFPDGETYVRIISEVGERDVLIAGSLDHPDEKILPIYLIASTARAMGARRVFLIAPYLPYLRQDIAFRPGESISARHFATLLSGFLDGLVTLDPHLHRIARLEDLFAIPALAASATNAVADWIREYIPDGLIVGPDSESAQWVSRIAERARRPFIVMHKERRGDRDVSIDLPPESNWRTLAPVVVDDIISTGRTMIAAMSSLGRTAGRPAVCIGVHAICAPDVVGELRIAGASRVLTCNSVMHETNGIDINDAIADQVIALLKS